MLLRATRSVVLVFAAVVLTACNGGGGSDNSSPPAAPVSQLDTLFGSGGKATVSGGIFMAMAVQADGKLVAVGSAAGGGNDDFMVARFNADGTPDMTFGTGGKVTTDFGSDEHAYAVALQANGKIVVTGEFLGTSAGTDAIAVARYNANGTLDVSFDDDGKVTTQINGDSDVALSVKIQTDGKIVVAGTSYNDTTLTDIALVRYNANGSLDTGFNTTGKVTTDVGGDFDIAYGVVLQSDGKIVIAGSTFDATNANDDVALVRYNANGSRDNSFGASGMVTTDFNGRDDAAASIVIQNDGKLVIAGRSASGADPFYEAQLARYNADGTLDIAFGSGGRVMTDIAAGSMVDGAMTVALQSDGKIVIAGMTDVIHGDIALARYNPGGSLDTAYGSAGIVRTDFSGANDQAYGLAIQSDGKAVVAGSTNNDAVLVRYMP